MFNEKRLIHFNESVPGDRELPELGDGVEKEKFDISMYKADMTDLKSEVSETLLKDAEIYELATKILEDDSKSYGLQLLDIVSKIYETYGKGKYAKFIGSAVPGEHLYVVHLFEREKGKGGAGFRFATGNEVVFEVDGIRTCIGDLNVWSDSISSGEEKIITTEDRKKVIDLKMNFFRNF